LWPTWWQDRTVSPFRTSGGANVEPVALPLVPHNKYLRTIDGFVLPPPALAAAYKRQLSWDDEQVLWYSVRLSVCMSVVPPSHFEAEEVPPTPASEQGDASLESEGIRSSPVPIGVLSSLPPPPSSRGATPSHEPATEEKSEELVSRDACGGEPVAIAPSGDQPVIGNALGLTLLPPPPPRVVSEGESPTSRSDHRVDEVQRDEAKTPEQEIAPASGEVVAASPGAAGSPAGDRLGSPEEKSDEPTSPIRESVISTAVESPPQITDSVPSSQTAASVASLAASPGPAVATRPQTPSVVQASRSPVPLPRTPIPAHFVLKRWSHHPSDVAPEIQYSPHRVSAPLNLSRLGLSTTTLSSFTLGGFTRVRCLNLSRNKLTDITQCGLQLMKALNFLDLHDNNISWVVLHETVLSLFAC
jgi:hypothetical protein